MVFFCVGRQVDTCNGNNAVLIDSLTDKRSKCEKMYGGREEIVVSQVDTQADMVDRQADKQSS